MMSKPREARLTEAHALIDASWFAVGATDRERFRALRHSLPELVIETMRRRGFLNMGTDYAVPIARDGEMPAFYRKRLEQQLPDSYVIYGHMGDAHLHVNMLPATQAEADIATGLLREFAEHAVSLGGTVSAEHGLGKRKAKLLELQYSQEEIDAMRRIKQRLDPPWLSGGEHCRSALAYTCLTALHLNMPAESPPAFQHRTITIHEESPCKSA